jgi:hypothetical protein
VRLGNICIPFFRAGKNGGRYIEEKRVYETLRFFTWKEKTGVEI